MNSILEISEGVVTVIGERDIQTDRQTEIFKERKKEKKKKKREKKYSLQFNSRNISLEAVLSDIGEGVVTKK